MRETPTHSIMSNNTTTMIFAPRANVLAAALAYRILSTILAVVFGVVLAVEVWSLLELREKNGKTVGARPGVTASMNADAKYMRITLLLNTLWNFITFTMIAAVSYVDNIDPVTCDYMQRVYPSLSLQSAFLFFVKKASMVGRFQRSRIYHLIQQICTLGMYVFPFAVIPMCLAFFSGRVTREGKCGEHGEIWFVIMVVVLAVPLCGLMTYLFVIPIWENSSRVRHSGGGGEVIASKMFRVAKNNLIASGIAMFVTVLNGTSLCIANGLMSIDIEQYEFLSLVAVITAMIDMSVLGISIKVMTTIWLPKRIRQYLIKADEISATKSPAPVMKQATAGSDSTDTPKKQLSAGSMKGWVVGSTTAG